MRPTSALPLPAPFDDDSVVVVVETPSALLLLVDVVLVNAFDEPCDLRVVPLGPRCAAADDTRDVSLDDDDGGAIFSIYLSIQNSNDGNINVYGDKEQYCRSRNRAKAFSRLRSRKNAKPLLSHTYTYTDT